MARTCNQNILRVLRLSRDMMLPGRQGRRGPIRHRLRCALRDAAGHGLQAAPHGRAGNRGPQERGGLGPTGAERWLRHTRSTDRRPAAFLFTAASCASSAPTSRRSRSRRLCSTRGPISRWVPASAAPSRGAAAEPSRQALDAIGQVAVTEAVVTTGGTLKANHIVHAVGPAFQEQDLEKKLRPTIINALKRADAERHPPDRVPGDGRRVLRDPSRQCAPRSWWRPWRPISRRTRASARSSSAPTTTREYLAFEARLAALEPGLRADRDPRAATRRGTDT